MAVMRSMGLTELDLNGQTGRPVSGGSRDARHVMSALGIPELNPPRFRRSALKPQKPRCSDKSEIRLLFYRGLRARLTNMS